MNIHQVGTLGKVANVVGLVAFRSLLYGPPVVYAVYVMRGGERNMDWEARFREHLERMAEAAERQGKYIIGRRLTRLEKILIFERDSYICQYCSRYTEDPDCDHVIPWSRGGSDASDNLVTACRACNGSKHNKTPKEWVVWLAKGHTFRKRPFVAKAFNERAGIWGKIYVERRSN
jgi:hypothetical protein